MRFRLFYEGNFFASQGEPKDNQIDRRASHKHELRRAFHFQLRDLWQERSFLREATTAGPVLGAPKGEEKLLKDKLEEISPVINDYRFVPIVHEKLNLTCSLNVLMMRRDRPGNRPGRIFQSRDIDNRLKTLFDALKMPRDEGELGYNRPCGDDNPLFVLLQKDELISHVSVETDDLLNPPPGVHEAYARLLIDVTIQPYDVNMFNLSLAGG